jgi:hypothetical protein
MLSWLKRRPRKEDAAAPTTESAVPEGHGMSHAYLSLHKYLSARYASVVVMTFAEVEDLLGSPLPAPARRDPAWWNSDDQRNFGHSNSWRLASRGAVANLTAQTVTFERA